MFAPPSLVATLVTLSPTLRDLPKGTRQAIAEAGDVPGPGRYRVVGAPSGLNVRESGSTNAKILATVPNGTLGTSDGTIDNGFAFVQYDTGPGGWSSVAYLAPEAQAPVSAGGGAPNASDLPAGTYIVTTQTDPLNIRSQPSTQASIVGTIPKGAAVKVTGVNQNFFAAVDYQGKLGWAAAAYLSPESSIVQGGDGGLILSGADLLQLRAMLVAWANATQGAPSYGSAADLELTQAAMNRQGVVLAAFQNWSNNTKGTLLRTDGIVDQPTRDALVQWSGAAVAAADPAGGPGLPTLPVNTPAPGAPPAPPPEAQGAPVAEQASKAGLFAVLAIGLAAFLLLEEKKKKRAA